MNNINELPFKPVGINSSIYSQELFIDVNDESMINELLWRVEKHILDKDLSEKINNLTINISTEIYKNSKNDIEIYIRFKDINNNEYAHTSIHLTGDCFDKKLNGILHTKNIKTGARIKIHVDFYGFKAYKNTEKNLDINKEYISMKYTPNSIRKFKNITKSNIKPEYNDIINVLNTYINPEDRTNYLKIKKSNMKIKHPLMDSIICKRKRKFKLSTTYRAYPKYIHRITQRKKTYKHKSQQTK